MTTVKKVKSYLREFAAYVQGDDAKALGEKVLRQANSALSTQISSMTFETVTFEDKVEAAKEKLHIARLNGGQLITDRNRYITNLTAAKNELTLAEKALKDHLASLTFLKTTLEEFDKEEEAAE